MPGKLEGPAAIGDGAGGVAIKTILTAPPQAGEVRIRLTAAGLCHTDIASMSWPGPLVMGHEGAGYVEWVGEGVHGLSAGMPVLLNWAIPCGHCPQCGRGNTAICDRTLEVDPATYGTSRSHAGATTLDGQAIERAFNLGTLSQHSVVRAEAVTPLPDWLEPERACVLGCAVMTGVGSVINIAQVQPGDTVAVVGCGGVGLNIIMGAVIAGATTVIAIDRNTDSLGRAVALGATHTILMPEGDHAWDEVTEAVKALTGRHGVDHAFEATGRAELSFLVLQLARNGGNALQVSGSHGDVTVNMPKFFWNKRYLTPLYGGCHPARDFPKLFDWVKDGRIDLDGLITRQYSLSELGLAIDDTLSKRTAKGVLRIPA